MRQNISTFTIFVFVHILLYCRASFEVLRPRGVSLSTKIFYIPDKDFSCIDGSNIVPFNFVNDDYCDCADGSDEPGTAACSNAFFHCVNSGHSSLDIPSSRVNDNICDCCDGSDEYNSTADCVNVCLELGRKAREELEKQQELYENGFNLWQKYSAEGKQLKENSKVQLENLKQTEMGIEKVLAEKEALKNAAEEKEKVVLDAHKALREEQQKKQEELEMLQHQEEEKKNAEIAFNELDLDHDNTLTFQELQNFPIFDSDGDGDVSETEAKFFLHMKDSMDLEEFVTTGWMIMKPIYTADKKSNLPLEPVTETPSSEGHYNEDYSNEEENGEENDEADWNDDLSDDDEPEKPQNFPPKEEAEPNKSGDESKSEEAYEYDEESQKILDAATFARGEYTSVMEKAEKLKEEIRQLQAFVDSDFGVGEQFAVLKGQCFDYEDREYTYRFCPFDKAGQINKDGVGKDKGYEVNLGKWGSWDGPDENKYLKMRYDNGLMCWNGPARSVMVLLQCGLENKLLSSSEPNRCEYLFEFATPAMCTLNQESSSFHRHTEL